jgi:hypothetical protein
MRGKWLGAGMGEIEIFWLCSNLIKVWRNFPHSGQEWMKFPEWNNYKQSLIMALSHWSIIETKKCCLSII